MTTRTHPPRFPCYTTRASAEDVEEFFGNVGHESKDGKYQILVRKWYHNRGLGTPYVQKTNDTDKVCSIQWVVTARDLEKAGFVDRFPSLQEDEYIVENTYTLERFRGKGVQSSTQMPELMLNQGFKRVKGIIAEDNIPMLRFRGRIPSAKVFERVLERHLLFRVSHKTLERYDPPVPFTIPDKK